MAGKTGSVVKAGATVAAGGGPQDPAADAAAIGRLAGRDTPKAAAKKTGGGGAAAKAGARTAAEKTSAGGKKTIGWAWSDNRKLLAAQFVVCVVVLGLGTLVSPEDSKHDVPRAMIKGSALAAVFFLLALVATGGQKPARAANAVGTLITAAYVLTSADVHNIVTWIAGFFSPASAGEKLGSPVSSKPAAGEAEGGGEISPGPGTSVLGVMEA